MIDQDLDSFGDQADEGMQYCMENPGNATHTIGFHPNILNKDKLQKMIFRDEIPDGFVGLDEDGDLHPLHPTHYNDKKHSNDKKWNGYGIGGGDAQMNTCEDFEIYTNYKTKNGVMKPLKVKANWQKLLENEQTGEDSFPEQIPITTEEYHKNHKNDKGSTLIYNDCREEIYDDSFDNIVEKLRNYSATTYSKALLKANINGHKSLIFKKFDVNGNCETIPIEPILSPFDDENHPHPIIEIKIHIASKMKMELEKIKLSLNMEVNSGWLTKREK